jgi:hypothetical protein
MSNGKEDPPHDHPGTWRTWSYAGKTAEEINAWLEQATDDGYDYDSLKQVGECVTIYKVLKGHK